MGIWRKERGATILLALLVLAVGSALVISMSFSRRNSLASARMQEYSARALDLAENGLEIMFQRLWMQVNEEGDFGKFADAKGFDTGEIAFAGGTMRVTTKPVDPAGGTRLLIVGSGTFQGITRRVEQVLEINLPPGPAPSPTPPPDTLTDDYGTVSGGDTVINKACPGSYYAEENITAWGNEDNFAPGEKIYLGTPSGNITTSLNRDDERVILDENPPPPQTVHVDLNAMKAGADVVFEGSITWNDLPPEYYNLLIYVEGDLVIHHDIDFDDIDFAGPLKNLTLAASGNITISKNVRFHQDGVVFNVIAGGNITFHQPITANHQEAEAFFYSGGNMVFNGHHSLYGDNFSCRMRTEGNLTINGEISFQVKPMTINIPGVTIGPGGGPHDENGHDDGDNEDEDDDENNGEIPFTIVRWREL